MRLRRISEVFLWLKAYPTAFIDPLFSSGVHLAMTGGLSAALTIASSIRGSVTEEKAAEWHSTKVRTAYARSASSLYPLFDLL